MADEQTQPIVAGEQAQPKSIFESKTAALAAIVAATGAVNEFYPQTGEFVKAHMLSISIGLSALMIFLRRITHDKVVLFT